MVPLTVLDGVDVPEGVCELETDVASLLGLELPGAPVEEEEGVLVTDGEVIAVESATGVDNGNDDDRAGVVAVVLGVAVPLPLFPPPEGEPPMIWSFPTRYAGWALYRDGSTNVPSS